MFSIMDNKKIYIVTSYYGNNVGSSLQCFALSKVIAKNGYEPIVVSLSEKRGILFLNKIKRISIKLFKGVLHPTLLKKQIQSKMKKKKNDDSNFLFETFNNSYLPIKNFSYKELNVSSRSKDCVACVAGSDQIWNTEEAVLDKINYLLFSPKEKNIAYAPSFGQAFIYNYNKRFVKNALKNISYLSCREAQGCSLIEKLIGKKAEHVLDPTLLLSKDEWLNCFKIKSKEDNSLFVYLLDSPSEMTINLIKSKKDCYSKIVLYCKKDVPDSLKEDIDTFVDCDPISFIKLISQSGFVITDSFHGTIFSILFEKSFITVERNYKNVDGDGNVRINDLLNIFNLKEFFVKENLAKLESPNYKVVHEILQSQKEKSINYLFDSIKSTSNPTE